MFYIDQNSSSFRSAQEAHLKNVSYVVNKKLFGNKFKALHPDGLKQNISQIKDVDTAILSYFKKDGNLEEIINGTPDVLNKLKYKFKGQKYKWSLTSIFNYKSFTDKNPSGTFRFYNAYTLADNLNIQTCIYCNRLYTHTVETDKGYIIRPNFDHWFPKSKFPLLALSFYNLIPCCPICNTGKGSISHKLERVFHPYFKHLDSNSQMSFRFSYDMENEKEANCKLVADNEFSDHSIEVMKLKEVYSMHKEEVRELIYLKKAYSQSYISSLRSILDKEITDSELYRLAFGVHLEAENLHKRPLSKLKKDILKELGILGI